VPPASPVLSRRKLIVAAGGLLIAPRAFAEDAGHAPARRAPAAARAPAAHAETPHVEAAHAEVAGGLTPEAAMARLVAGNARYATGQAMHGNQDAHRRMEVATGQTPFATILACADSRVAPELIFDQGLGDLFTVRVAGNVVDDAVLASIEYSVIHLGSTLIMVLGHERCGAVKATIDALDGKGSPDDAGTRIGALAALIAPAVRAAPADGDRVDATVSLNASHAAAEIFAGSPPLRARVLAGKLKIVAARYDLDDGMVTPTKPETA